MKRRSKSTGTKSLAAMMSLGVAISSCKMPTLNTPGDNSSEVNALSAAEKEQLKKEVASFSATAKELASAHTEGVGACQKLDILWKQVVATKQPDDKLIPPDAVLGDALKFGNGSVNRFWRIFQGFGSSKSDIRPFDTKQEQSDYLRLTHRYSVMAKMKFVVDEKAVTALGYTGQYASGNDCILGRLSSAVPTNVVDRMTPAFSGKFFLGGKAESQTLITQHDIGGQSSGTDYTVDPPKVKSITPNFYHHNLSNRLSFEKGVYSGVGAFSRFYYTAQWYSKDVLKLDYVFDPRELAANHLAEYTKEGQIVANPKGPRFLWTLPPSEEVKAEFAQLASQDTDFRKAFLAQNAKMAGDKQWTVFNVYASDTWTYNPQKDAKLIGKIVTSSAFTVSDAADTRIFFKHALQRHKVKNTEGQEVFAPAVKIDYASKNDTYHQDFAVSDWNPELFTSDCRLGVLKAETIPSKEGGLDGSFLWGAIVSPKTARKNANGLCFPQVISKRLQDAITPYLSKL